jgi:hypothetical protein
MYPNGKIFIGKDLTDRITDVGSVDSALVAIDFTREQRRGFTLRKEILWESATATDSEASLMEIALIRLYCSDDPASIGCACGGWINRARDGDDDEPSRESGE